MAPTNMAHTKMELSKLAHAKTAQNGRLMKMAQWSYF